VPVTARLLQRLQETLGDEAMADLLAWLDESARGQRAGVREVADLYYHRFDTRLEDGLSALRSELIARLETGLAAQRAELLKWMFVFWVGTIVPLAGLILALHRA